MRSWASVSKLRTGIAIIVGLFLLIQLVPYGRDHANPPVTRAAKFDSSKTEMLVNQACSDCHSNLTTWPIDSNIAPASWLIQHDVDGGRQRLNFSEWDHPQPGLDELTQKIKSGEMPPLQYKILHPSARLSDSEKATLVSGLTKTYGQDPPITGGTEVGDGD
ncbi:heme-binding domain-containing protein [soil metagenome]